jgi:hypothetical protein
MVMFGLFPHGQRLLGIVWFLLGAVYGSGSSGYGFGDA